MKKRTKKNPTKFLSVWVCPRPTLKTTSSQRLFLTKYLGEANRSPKFSIMRQTKVTWHRWRKVLFLVMPLVSYPRTVSSHYFKIIILELYRIHPRIFQTPRMQNHLNIYLSQITVMQLITTA